MTSTTAQDVGEFERSLNQYDDLIVTVIESDGKRRAYVEISCSLDHEGWPRFIGELDIAFEFKTSPEVNGMAFPGPALVSYANSMNLNMPQHFDSIDAFMDWFCNSGKD